MRTTKDEAVEGTLTRKELQARDGAAAMAEYQAARQALVDNTARLRALRLAREAGDVKAKAAPAKKIRVAASRQK
jgi:nitrate/nitrite-specific signal transduction histidine kinase